MPMTANILKNDGTKVYLTGVDRTFKMKFNLNALYYLEKAYGDINKALTEIQGGQIQSLISITTAAINAGGNGEIFTEEQIAEMIAIDDLETLAEALQELLGAGEKAHTPS